MFTELQQAITDLEAADSDIVGKTGNLSAANEAVTNAETKLATAKSVKDNATTALNDSSVVYNAAVDKLVGALTASKLPVVT